MRTRKPNTVLLKKRIKEYGLAMLAVKSGCSPSLLEKIAGGRYTNGLTLKTVDGLCEATGDPMDELFPFCENEKESA